MRGDPDLDGPSVSTYGQSFVRECLEAVLVDAEDSYEEPVEVESASHRRNSTASASAPSTPKAQVARIASRAEPPAFLRKPAQVGSPQPDVDLSDPRRDLQNRIYAPPKLPRQVRRPQPNHPSNPVQPSPRDSPMRQPSPRASPVRQPSPRVSPVRQPSPRVSPVRQPSPRISPPRQPPPRNVRESPREVLPRPGMRPASSGLCPEDKKLEPQPLASAADVETVHHQARLPVSAPQPEPQALPRTELIAAEPKADNRPMAGISRLLKEACDHQQSGSFVAEAFDTREVLQGALAVEAACAPTVKKAPELRLPALMMPGAQHMPPNQPSSSRLPQIGAPRLDLQEVSAGAARDLLPESSEDPSQRLVHRERRMPLFLRMQRNYELQELQKEAAVREERLRQLAVHAIPAPQVVKRLKKRPKGVKRRRVKQKTDARGGSPSPYAGDVVDATALAHPKRRIRKEKRAKAKKHVVVPVLTVEGGQNASDEAHDGNSMTGWDVD